jgi:hypothetical protein
VILLLLLISWAVGLAVYAGFLSGVRGEVLSLDNWVVIGTVTMVAWLVASVLVTVPVLRRLAASGAGGPRIGVLTVASVVLAIVPVWLNVGIWYGWHPRHLLIDEVAFLGAHYATSGLVLSLSLGRIAARRAGEPR